jgi:hypothetical protein
VGATVTVARARVEGAWVGASVLGENSGVPTVGQAMGADDVGLVSQLDEVFGLLRRGNHESKLLKSGFRPCDDAGG